MSDDALASVPTTSVVMSWQHMRSCCVTGTYANMLLIPKKRVPARHLVGPKELRAHRCQQMYKRHSNSIDTSKQVLLCQ